MADNIEPISHLEKVITGNAEPISHLEQIIALYGGTGGSGGSGTTNYNALLNKPSINGVDLVGNKTLADLGITNYNDTQVKKDIVDLQADKQDKTDNTLDTTDKTVVGAINEINGNALDTVTFSADYKNIIINRKSGNNPYTIPIASIIHNAKLIELNDVDSTDIGDGKTLIYDSATQKHKYVSSTGTDELVKMDSTTDAKHLSELIDKQTIVNDGGVLKVKKLDGQNVTIAEINHLKGLTMNVMDLVNAFANGGVKVLNTPVATHADLSTLDRSTFLDGISYIVYVLADETHSGAKTTYLCNKTSETFFGNADSQRNFTTDPINLANEVTGKLGTANIDVDALWKLLTINDTYKTLTTKDEVFGTHGAKALYDELVAEIGKKANATDLTTHTSDTNIHITSAERTAWNNKANSSDLTSHTGDTDIHITTSERTAWNNKANTTDLTTHTSDTNIHVTTSERTKWNEVDNKVDKTSITTTIDDSSTDNQVPSAKSIYYNCIEGIELNQTTIDTYGTEILKYPLGIWRINSDDLASKFTDLPVKTSGRIEITSIDPNTNKNPLTSSWSYRVYNFESYTGENYIRKITSANTVGVIDTDTSWQKVCTTSVEDMSPSEISSFVDTDVSGVINYRVKNGICFVKLWGIKSTTTGAGKFLLNNLSMPIPSCFDTGNALFEANGDGTANAFAFVDTNGALIVHFYKANSLAYGTFSYPVKES